MLLRDLLAPLDAIEGGGDLDREVLSVTRDSRELCPGALFVAVRGGSVDGHALVPGLQAGVGVVIEHAAAVPAGLGWIRVADTRRALAFAAAAVEGWPSRRVPVVGVTGTNGKTTITTLLHQAVQASGGSAGRIGTTGVDIGDRPVPSALTTPEAPRLQRLFREMADAGVELVAMEVSSIGLVQRRVDAIGFAVAVFTNFTQDHLDFHGTMEAYAAAKATLFTEQLRAPGGPPRALLCGDDPGWRLMSPPEDRWLYGFGADNDLQIVHAELGAGGMVLELQTPFGAFTLRSPLVGHHNALNLVAAFGAGVLAGVPPERMVAGLASARGAPGRLEVVADPRGEVLVVVDYAHSPDALEVALRSMRASCRGALWVVFGCGGDRDRGKRPLMGQAALAADHVVVTSDNPRSEAPEAIIAEILAGLPAGAPVHVEVDRAAAIGWALRRAAPGDAVLLAGKGHEDYQEIAGVKHPFDDRRVAASALEERT